MLATSPSDAPKMVVVRVTESASFKGARFITVKSYRFDLEEAADPPFDGRVFEPHHLT
jgi:hypothetical protein